MASGRADGSSALPFARRVGRAAFAAASALLTLVLGLFGLLRLRSPGRPKPILDEDGRPTPGSISEKIYVTVNGVRQGMFIKGRDATNPVLLYLHGGMPDYFLTERYPTGLDDCFTVVWWEQRGSGLSFSPDIPPESMTAQQVVADTIDLTKYLRTRFGQDKIYLMGHSGGTFFSIQAAALAPELYHAYIGVAQMSCQLESEKLAYRYMLQQFKDDGDAKMVRRLEKGPVTDSIPLPKSYGSVRDVAMHKLGIGTMHSMKSIVSGLLVPSFLNRECTLGEKIRMWRGKLFAGRFLWNEQLAADLRQRVTELQVPVYFLHGIHDFTVSYPLAKAYCEQLRAPMKGFYTFERSAHSPLFEEPQKMRQIMLADVLTGANGLADAGSAPYAPSPSRPASASSGTEAPSV